MDSTFDEKMMRLALDEAAAAEGDVPVGALVVRDGIVLARACNRREALLEPFAHAEMLAMAQAAEALKARRLADCTLYVTLEPCPMCAGAIIMAGVRRLVFGAFDRQYGCCGSVYALPLDERFGHRVSITGGVLEAEASALIRRFFQKKRG